jgi:hypothetical protein
MKNLPHQKFQFLKKSWNLDEMTFKCLLAHYTIIMAMIMIY